MKAPLLIISLALTLAVSACDQLLPGSTSEERAVPTEISPEVVEPTPVAMTPFEQRVADLVTIRDALEAYKNDNGGYPDTRDAWASVGHRKTNNWLPDLVPNYLETLPQDPGRSWDSTEAQYLYKSDGVGYKLVSHKSGDCNEVTPETPAQWDPKRSHEKGCWAYGFWTPEYVDK